MKVDFTVRVPARVHLVATTVNGDVSADRIGGNVHATTVNGDIDVTAAGYVKASTVNGGIEASLGRMWRWRRTAHHLSNVRIWIDGAEAARVEIRLIASHPTVRLRIKDDGKGFDVQQVLEQAGAGGNLGLISLSERVDILNGNAGNRSFRAPLAEALSDRGLAVLLFDYRSYGRSEGHPSERGCKLDAA